MPLPTWSALPRRGPGGGGRVWTGAEAEALVAKGAAAVALGRAAIANPDWATRAMDQHGSLGAPATIAELRDHAPSTTPSAQSMRNWKGFVARARIGRGWVPRRVHARSHGRSSAIWPKVRGRSDAGERPFARTGRIHRRRGPVHERRQIGRRPSGILVLRSQPIGDGLVLSRNVLRDLRVVRGPSSGLSAGLRRDRAA